MSELTSFIGRRRTACDEITRPALLRIASLLDRDDSFAPGDPIPAHWYAMFFPDIAPQSQLGADGHPRRGDFLPPVPLPRRMFAGRRVRFLAPLRVGDVAEKRSTIAAVTPKTGRSGAMVFVTVRHAISAGGRVAVEEEQDVVYRDHPAPGAPPPAPTPAPDSPAWSARMVADTRMLFRYSAITWNGHRIHYDADYTRAEEGYPGLVVNGGLTLLLLLEAALAETARPLAGLSVRNVSPLFAGQPVTLAGTAPDGEGAARAWAAGPQGGLAVAAELTFAV